MLIIVEVILVVSQMEMVATSIDPNDDPCAGYGVTWEVHLTHQKPEDCHQEPPSDDPEGVTWGQHCSSIDGCG